MRSAAVDRAPARAGLEQSRSPGEDAGLVGRIVDGDSAALDAIYHRYGRSCYGLARRILADEQLAQDVVQEVFLTLWRDARRFDAARGAFSTWLLSMTHHKAVDVVRREENLRRRRTSLEAWQAHEPGPMQVDEEVWIGVRRDRVRSALAALPDAQREAIGLAYFGGYTQREIAGLTGTPLGTIKTRTLAGLRRMRQALDAPLAETEQL